MIKQFRNNWSAGWVLALICVVSFATMAWVSNQESSTMDELAHIPSGYSYVHNFDYRLNPEHPPLLKALAGIPLLFGGFNFPTNIKAWTTDVNGQWDMGRAFFYESGNDADRLIHLARVGPMLLTVLLIIMTWLFAAEIIGKRWALIPAAIVGLSPNFLAHGHYVTTDVAAAFGVIFSTYYFIHYLHKPKWTLLLKAGLAFGVAQLCKFSAVLLIPYLGFMAVMFGFAIGYRGSQGMGFLSRSWRMFIQAWNYGWRSIFVMVIGFILLIYPVYYAFTLNYPLDKQVADTKFILSSFAGGPTPPGMKCNLGRCMVEANIWMAGNPVLRPVAEYSLGILMVMQRSSGGNRNYFMGEVADGGWRSYFPTVYALKEPLPIVIMVAVALLGGLWTLLRGLREGRRTKRFFDWLGVNFAEFAMLFFIAFYWAYSIQSPLNIGFRHLFPTLPFIYILTVRYWKSWLGSVRMTMGSTVLQTLSRGLRALFASSLKYLAFIFLLAWFLVETVASAPYYLSYFNQLGGGISGGYRYVTDSNYDWGQDLIRLRTFVNAHPEINKIGVHYFGGGQPGYYLGRKNENWWPARGNPAEQGIHWLAISINELQGSTQPARMIKDPSAPGGKRMEINRKPEDEYRWLTALRQPRPGMGNVPEPDYRLGTSLFVYKL